MVLELTICHETNIHNSKSYKQTKYQYLRSNLESSLSTYSLELFTIEVSSLGFISSTKDFCKAIDVKEMPAASKNIISHSVIKSSHEIYLARNLAV